MAAFMNGAVMRPAGGDVALMGAPTITIFKSDPLLTASVVLIADIPTQSGVIHVTGEMGETWNWMCSIRTLYCHI